MGTKAAPMPRRSRGYRWLIGLTILAVLLAAYVMAVRYFALRLETDIQKSLRTVPVATDTTTRPAAD